MSLEEKDIVWIEYCKIKREKYNYIHEKYLLNCKICNYKNIIDDFNGDNVNQYTAHHMNYIMCKYDYAVNRVNYLIEQIQILEPELISLKTRVDLLWK